MIPSLFLIKKYVYFGDTSAPMDIHFVRVPQDGDVVNVRWKPAKWGERPAFFPVHVTAMNMNELYDYNDDC